MTYDNKGYCREEEELDWTLPELSLNLLAHPCFPNILIHVDEYSNALNSRCVLKIILFFRKTQFGKT